MPSVTEEQVQHLASKADDLRDKCILMLLFDSGMRLTELTNIERYDINWDSNTIIVIGKGNKQRRAPFTQKTGELLHSYLANNQNRNGNIWGIQKRGVQTLLKKLSVRTDIKCNPHAFRRGFACNLHRKGLSTLDIMHLGGWEDLGMVLSYTRSITFDDCLKHYQEIE